MLASLLVYTTRAVIVIFFTWLIVNLMGKKSAAQMTPYEMALLFIISNVASQPLLLQDPLRTGIALITLFLVVAFLARLSLFKPFYEMDSKPSMLIIKGQIDEVALRKNRMNLPMLCSQLRLQGYFKIQDVHYAILESNGELSILPNSGIRPVTPEDLKLKLQQEEPAIVVIMDGNLMFENLRLSGFDEAWLSKQLHQQLGNDDVQQVFFAEIAGGQLYALPYSKRKNKSFKKN